MSVALWLKWVLQKLLTMKIHQDKSDNELHNYYSKSYGFSKCVSINKTRTNMLIKYLKNVHISEYVAKQEYGIVAA